MRLTHRPSRNALLLFLLCILVGIVLIQMLWYLGARAGNYESNEYEPKDVERQIYEERQRPVNGR